MDSEQLRIMLAEQSLTASQQATIMDTFIGLRLVIDDLKQQLEYARSPAAIASQMRSAGIRSMEVNI